MKGRLGLCLYTCAIVLSVHLYVAGKWDHDGARRALNDETLYPWVSPGGSRVGGSSSYNKYNSTLKFFFVVGLEGSGHHLMTQLANHSPDVKLLQEWDIMPVELRQMNRKLFNKNAPTKALWNAHCQGVEGIKSANFTDVAQVQRGLVKQMQKMEKMALAKAANTSSGFRQVHVPINTAKVNNRPYGMVSYPNFGGPCRRVNIPSLDLLYQSCDQAHVDCGHVYIYRDPNQVIKSTSIKRRYNKDLLQAINMYTSHLNTISAEMHAFPGHTWGCYGLLEPVAKSDSGSKQAVPWMSEVSRLWGWRNLTDFEEYMASIYRPPKPSGHNFISPKLEPYRIAMERAHEQSVQICEQAEQRNVWASQV